MSYHHQSCTISWCWSKCWSHALASSSKLTCHIATSALPLLVSEAPLHDTPCWQDCSFCKILGRRFVHHLHLQESRNLLIASRFVQGSQFFWTDIRRFAFVTLFACITRFSSKIEPVRFQEVSYLLLQVFIICFSSFSNMLNVSSKAWSKELTRSQWRTPLWARTWNLGLRFMRFTVIQGSVFSKLSLVSSLADLWGTNPWSAWPRFASSKTGISVSLAGFGGCVLAYSITSLASYPTALSGSRVCFSAILEGSPSGKVLVGFFLHHEEPNRSPRVS